MVRTTLLDQSSASRMSIRERGGDFLGVRSGIAGGLSPESRIAYQDEPGANSVAACLEMFPRVRATANS
jgi:hypothetical protein